MKDKIITIALALSLILTLINSQGTSQPQTAKAIPTSKVGDLIKGVNYKIDQGKSFHLINIPTLDKKYLFFSVITDEIYKHLDLNISIFRSGQQVPVRSCVKQEVDSCYLSKDQLRVNQTVFVVVDSGQDQCEYQLKTYWSDLEHLIVGKQVRFMFSKQQQRQIYHLELSNIPFQELRIIIKPETRRFAFDKIKMYGTFGKDSSPSSSKYDFTSIYLWQDAQGIYLSRKQLKQLTMNLILEGTVQTIYTIKCDIVSELHNDIALNDKIYEYLLPKQTHDYHIQFKNAQGVLEYDTYVFRLALFTNSINIRYFTNKEKTNRMPEKQPLMYMGDMQHFFTKEEIEKSFKDGIFIEASSDNKISTFMMEFEGRNHESSLELHQYIYEFIHVQNKTVAYFKLARFGQQNAQNLQILRVTFALIKVVGKVAVQFRKCNSNSTHQNCLGPAYAAVSSKIQTQYRSVGSKESHTITLTTDFWKNVNFVEKNAIILVVLINLDANSSALAAVEYNVGNRPEFLREGKPIESHIRKSQLKVYKFVNADVNIKKVRLHINKISGNFQVYAFRHEPSEQQLQKNSNKVTSDIYQIAQKLTEDPLVIVISGQDSATYSLIVQSVHKDEEELNSITLSEDLEFKIKIGPNKYEIFEIVPISSNIFFKYSSSGAAHVCTLNQQQICDQKQAQISNQGQVVKEGFYGRFIHIKIRNPSSTKSIQVTSIFHSARQDHCEARHVGRLYKQVIKQGACFSTIIHIVKDFEVVIIREQIGQLSYSMLLCDKILNFAKKESGQQKYLISSQQIQVACKDRSQNVFTFATSGKVTNPAIKQELSNIHIKYLVQYTDNLIILPDGVGYHGSEITTEEPVKKFTYGVLNKQDTTIVLTTNKKLSFLVKFVETAYRDNVKIGLNDYDLSSPSEKFYFLNSIFLKITADNLKAAKCIECDLLIYVYSKEEVGTSVDFTIEVTQNYAVLDEGVPKSGYLVKDSKAFYGFNIKADGNLLVEVSDNNNNCAIIYLSHNQYPDQNNNLEHSFDGQIIREVSALSTYYIAIKARKNCAYTVTAALSHGKNHLVKLHRAVLGYANFEAGEVKYYLFKHMSDMAFKIISLHVYGHVEFYINKTSLQKISQLVKSQKIDYKGFTYHSQHKNRLFFDNKNKQFCKDCYYILAVQAIKHTESSIFLGDQETKIPLSEEKVLNDLLLKKGSITKAEIYYITKGVLEVKVHSGRLQVTIDYNSQSLKEVFEKNKELVTYNFTLKQNKEHYLPVTLTFKALEDNTVYSSRVKTQQSGISGSSQYGLISSDSPNYAYIIRGKQSCMNGFLRRADQKIFVSFSSNERQDAKKIKITGKLFQNQTTIAQDITRNVISINFIKVTAQLFKQAIPYSLCFFHQQKSFSLTIMQTQQASLLPQNTEMLVTRKQVYNLYPEGDFLLDVFECRGTSKISYGKNLEQLKTSKPKILDLIGMPDQSHAVRLQAGYSNLLLGVQGQLSLIRWLPINEEKEQGLGYFIYSAGSLKYDSVFGQIQFIVEPIKQMKKTKSIFRSAVYNFYISNSQEDLKQASLCQKFLPNSVFQLKLGRQSLNSKTIKFTIQKKKLLQKYHEGKNLFANIVADVFLVTPKGDSEEYRFIYKSQQIPAEIFIPSQLQTYDFTTLIVALVLFIVAIITLGWVFAKIVVPLIGRLRNRMLVEENGLQNSKENKEEEIKQQNALEPPPSSDRQTMNFNIAPQTENQM